MKIANLNIGTRLGGGFALMNMLILACIAIALLMMARMQQATTTIVQQDTPKMMQASAAMDDVNDIALALSNLLIIDGEGDRAKQYTRIAAARKLLDAKLAYLKANVHSDEGQKMLQKLQEADAGFAGGTDKMQQLVKAGDNEGATDFLIADMRVHLMTYKKLIEQTVKLQTERMEEAAGEAQASYLSSRNLLLALGAVAVLGSLVMGVLLTRSITRPVQRALDVANTVAAGDLTSQIEADWHDETGQLLQALARMNAALVDIVGEVRGGTETIASASAQIASGNLDLSARTEQQAGALEETASSLEELTSIVRQNEDNARQANQLALTASDIASRGGEVVSQVVQTMDEINGASKKVVDIIAVIDGIAFQTNILALNAAVEAARAGQQGRGFAVVASEVRNLAQRSASAAKEIKALIDDSVGKVATGSRLVNQAGSTMQEVVSSIRRVTDIMAEISAASGEQSAGISHINEAVAQMDDTTQQNASLVEQAAAAAASMQEQAQRLAESVSVFRLATAAPGKRAALQAVPSTAVRIAAANPAPARKLVANSKDQWEEF